MSRWLVTLAAVAGLVAVGGAAYAQEEGRGPGRLEILINPVGGMFWTEGTEDGGGPDFGQFHTAVSATWNIDPYWAVEGEFAGGIGIEQRLSFPTPGTASIGDVTPPSSLAYQGNVLFYPWTLERSTVPYVTGGLGGLTMLDRSGFTEDDHTFFTANVGGGVKYFFARNWGVRGDYRFLWVDSSSDADPFFGRAGDRYGHRISGGVILNLAK